MGIKARGMTFRAMMRRRDDGRRDLRRLDIPQGSSEVMGMGVEVVPAEIMVAVVTPPWSPGCTS
jgi:hypothetical protein